MIRPSLIFSGLLIGLVLGVVYGWVISPVNYTDTAPAALRRDYRDQYLILIAQAYAADGDLDRARQRIASLGDADAGEAVTALAQQLAAAGKDSSALSALASALGVGISAVTSAPTPTLPHPHTPTPTITPTLLPSATPFPTLTPTATPVYDYELIMQENYCNDAERAPLIIVDVMDAAGAPLPGIKVSVKWAEGEDSFVTGLKPEISSSYGDFEMSVGVVYSAQIGSRTPPVAGLAAPTCVAAADGKPYAGAVRLVFQRK